MPGTALAPGAGAASAGTSRAQEPGGAGGLQGVLVIVKVPWLFGINGLSGCQAPARAGVLHCFTTAKLRAQSWRAGGQQGLGAQWLPCSPAVRLPPPRPHPPICSCRTPLPERSWGALCWLQGRATVLSVEPMGVTKGGGQCGERLGGAVCKKSPQAGAQAGSPPPAARLRE